MKIYDFIYDKLNRKKKKIERQRPHAPLPKHEVPREKPKDKDKEDAKSDRGVIVIQL
jgi:hypothetical protein